MQTLAFIPSIAESVIKRLTELIGRSRDEEREEEPGKIIHERREGEVSGSVLPFRRYYGTIDATPLYLMLVARYAKQSGVDSIKPFKDGIELALRWLLDKLNKDELGLLGYSGGVLSNQGWKDSWDSVFDSSGELLGYPRYLIEVQGYVFEALSRMDEVFPGQGLGSIANRVRDKIGLFWSSELGFFAEAIDGGGRLADVYTSNPGHLLWTHAINSVDARKAAEVLMGDRLFTGYGIKTLGFGEPRHDPTSYHNGSIWPHDNSIILKGLADYGLCEEFSAGSKAMLNAFKQLGLPGLPELYTGSAPRSPWGTSPSPGQAERRS